MALAIAAFVADGQVVGMAVAAFAASLNMFQRGGFRRDMLTAHPSGHHAMQLTSHGFVHFDAKVLQSGHDRIFLQNTCFFFRQIPALVLWDATRSMLQPSGMRRLFSTSKFFVKATLKSSCTCRPS